MAEGVRVVKATGKAAVRMEENRIVIEATEGLVAVLVAEGEASAAYCWHPISGWYLQAGWDSREDVGDGNTDRLPE